MKYRNGCVHVAGEMTVYTAATLKHDLLAEMDRHRRAKLLDLSEVTEIDTAGLQLLLIARRHASNHGQELSLLDPSRSVRGALELCQLSALLRTADKEPC